MVLPVADLSAQETPPLIQPNIIPGRLAITTQPFPTLTTVTAKAVPDRPVYGLYTWKGEYTELRKEIRKVGWKQLRFSGPWDDETMRMTIEDDIEVMYTLSGRKGQQRIDFASDEAFIADYLAKVDAFLTRYGPGGSFFADNPGLPIRPITALEIWNEPNFQYMIPDREPRAEVEREREALYAKLLPAAYQAIKTKWPDVRVLGFSGGGASACDLRFIANVWKQNPDLISHSFDILSTHPYVDPAPPEADSVRSWGSYSVAKSLATIRTTIESPTTPIWYTEVGWPMSKADGGYFSTKAGEPMVDPQLQAAYVCRMYALALRLGVERVHIMFATDTDNFNAGFFLRDKAWRPSAYAAQTMFKVMPFPKLTGAINDGNDGWCAWNFIADAQSKEKSPMVTMAFNIAGPKHVELPWPAPKATVVDMLGATRRISAASAADGTWMLLIDIGPCPVYLTPTWPNPTSNKLSIN